MVFALSVSLLLLILSEILGILSHRSAGSQHTNVSATAPSELGMSANRTRLITWRVNVLLLLAIILAALPYYQCYKALSQTCKLQARSSACTHAFLYCAAFIAESAHLKRLHVHVPPCISSCKMKSITPSTAALQQCMLNASAGRLTHLQASVGSTLSVLALLYAFWYLGKAWPAVATARGGFFSMQQAKSRPSNTDQPVIMHVNIMCISDALVLFGW